ncbi:MAG: hypothetical protein ACYC6Y_26355 [Thermoguttaceae bacterium]
MTRTIIYCSIVALALGLAIAPSVASEPAKAPEAAPVFRAGAATSNITPFLGGSVVGGFVPFPATNVHDELHARCLVLDDGRTRLALVVCDLLGVSYDVSRAARKRIQENSGIPPENVLICAVHTHSACSAMGQEPLDEYHTFVAHRIADAVQIAAGRLRPAEAAVVTGEAPEHVKNRRWVMKPGTAPPNPFGTIDQVKMNPPGGSPDLVEPAGPTDPQITILALREPSGRPIALFSAYSLHYVGGVGNGDISADYYGIYCGQIERLLAVEGQDPPFVAMMANGTSGDINNVNFRHPRPKKVPYEQMRYVAEDVAAKVHAALAKAEYRGGLTLGARYQEPKIARRQPTADQLAWAKATLEKPAAEPGKADLSAIYARRTLQLAERPSEYPVPLQVFRIGSLAIGSMPTEVFCEIGLEFRKQCPLQPAQLLSLSHGYYGYLPTPRHFPLGGYETWIGTNQLEPQASEKMLAALLDMATQLND